MTIGVGQEIDMSEVPNGKYIAKHFATLPSMPRPFVLVAIGVLHEVGDLTWTRVKDVPQRKAVLLDARGVGLRLLFHGSWAEQEMKAGQKWLVAYAEVSQNENDAKEVIAWVYDSAYALLISDVEDTPPIQCREMVQF